MTSGLCETSYIAAISSAVTTPDLEVETRKKRDRILEERRKKIKKKIELNGEKKGW